MTLKGEHMEKPCIASINQLSRLCATQTMSECYSLQLISEGSTSTLLGHKDNTKTVVKLTELASDTHPELTALLSKFQAVFPILWAYLLLDLVITVLLLYQEVHR